VSSFLTAHQHKYSAIHVSVRWKIWTEDKSKTDITQTKHNPEKVKKTKHSTTML